MYTSRLSSLIQFVFCCNSSKFLHCQFRICQFRFIKPIVFLQTLAMFTDSIHSLIQSVI